MGSGYSEDLYGLAFNFASTTNGGGNFPFHNASGVDWWELRIATAMPYGYVDDVWVALDSPTYYDVASDLFTSSALSFGDGGLTIRLWGLDDGHTGIPSTSFGPGDKSDREGGWGSHFTINLDDGETPGTGGWLGESHGPLAFSATANPVPEPATFALVLGGLLVLGFRSRRQR